MHRGVAGCGADGTQTVTLRQVPGRKPLIPPGNWASHPQHHHGGCRMPLGLRWGRWGTAMGCIRGWDGMTCSGDPGRPFNDAGAAGHSRPRKRRPAGPEPAPTASADTTGSHTRRQLMPEAGCPGAFAKGPVAGRPLGTDLERTQLTAHATDNAVCRAAAGVAAAARGIELPHRGGAGAAAGAAAVVPGPRGVRALAAAGAAPRAVPPAGPRAGALPRPVCLFGPFAVGRATGTARPRRPRPPAAGPLPPPLRRAPGALLLRRHPSPALPAPLTRLPRRPDPRAARRPRAPRPRPPQAVQGPARARPRHGGHRQAGRVPRHGRPRRAQGRPPPAGPRRPRARKAHPQAHARRRRPRRPVAGGLVRRVRDGAQVLRRDGVLPRRGPGELRRRSRGQTARAGREAGGDHDTQDTGVPARQRHHAPRHEARESVAEKGKRPRLALPRRFRPGLHRRNGAKERHGHHAPDEDPHRHALLPRARGDRGRHLYLQGGSVVRRLHPLRAPLRQHPLPRLGLLRRALRPHRPRRVPHPPRPRVHRAGRRPRPPAARSGPRAQALGRAGARPPVAGGGQAAAAAEQHDAAEKGRRADGPFQAGPFRQARARARGTPGLPPPRRVVGAPRIDPATSARCAPILGPLRFVRQAQGPRVERHQGGGAQRRGAGPRDAERFRRQPGGAGGCVRGVEHQGHGGQVIHRGGEGGRSGAVQVVHGSGDVRGRRRWDVQCCENTAFVLAGSFGASEESDGTVVADTADPAVSAERASALIRR